MPGCTDVFASDAPHYIATPAYSLPSQMKQNERNMAAFGFSLRQLLVVLGMSVITSKNVQWPIDRFYTYQTFNVRNQIKFTPSHHK